MRNADFSHSSQHQPKSNGIPLVTTVVGSWPKPDWLSSRVHDLSGWTVDRDWKFQAGELKVKQDQATELAIRQQEATRVDIVSDGEQRRDNYVNYFCRRLVGFDFEERTRIVSRSGTWTWSSPRIAGSVSSTGSSLVDDFRFTRRLTDRQVKVTIPGPMTIIDSAKNEYYRDGVPLAMDLAAAIRVEV
jgi:5-methyltetrahydropteroyltriglutamate--homocysteine methyltransferase